MALYGNNTSRAEAACSGSGESQTCSLSVTRLILYHSINCTRIREEEEENCPHTRRRRIREEEEEENCPHTRRRRRIREEEEEENCPHTRRRIAPTWCITGAGVRYHYVLQDVIGVIIGGTLGHALCTGLAVIGGRCVAQRISMRTGMLLCLIAVVLNVGSRTDIKDVLSFYYFVFFNINIFTCYMDFVENLILFQMVQKLWKSVNIWQSWQSYHWLCDVRFLSASLYVSKRGAYWDRLCRDVVGWLVVTHVHCGQTVHPRPIVTMEH